MKMENVGGQPLSTEQDDDEVQRLGEAWKVPGFSSETEPPKKEKKVRKIIEFPIPKHVPESKDFKEETSKRYAKGYRGKTKMVKKIDKEDKKTITFELDAVQQRRMKMEGKFDILKRAKQLNIVPESGRFSFHASGAPDALKLNPLLSLFFTEAWWKMSAVEKKECGYQTKHGLTNSMIKKYFMKMMHEDDLEKFKGVRFNITTNMDALIKKLHENPCRKKKIIPSLLDMDKSRGFVRLIPDKNLKSLGYANFIKLLESSKSKGVDEKEVNYLMTAASREKTLVKSKPSKDITPPAGSDDVLDGMKTPEEEAKSVLTAVNQGVHIKIVKYPDGRVEMDFKL
jgi:hypothetical protein